MAADSVSYSELHYQSEALKVREQSQLEMVWSRFRKHYLALAGTVVLGIFILAALAAPILAPRVPVGAHYTKVPGAFLPDPDAIDPPNQHLGPGEQGHILGTDEVGRDILARLLYGARVSLYVGIVTTILEETFGALIGAVAGYYGGMVDQILMRLVDFMLTLPLLPILLILSVLVAAAAPTAFTRLNYLILILVLFTWMSTARLMRGVVLTLRQQDFAEASRALGASHVRIILRHMMPNAFAPIIVSATLAVGTIIATEAGLSFLGFGVQPPTASWGNMLTSVQEYMFLNPTLAIWPGMCIFLTVLAVNFMGDGLRDALDPRMSK